MIEEEEITEKDLLQITPWKNRAEFVEVYELLFGLKSNMNTRKKAYDVMNIWKIRRTASLPASVSSTILIIEVQIKDQNKMSNEELQTMYSTVCTRFLNFMTSITTTKKFKSMYASVQELGLETFLVDLRHLFAHGQILPSLDILQRSSIYCLDWLKTYYWDRQLNDTIDVTVGDMRLISSEIYHNKLKMLFNIYDNVTEALHKGYKDVDHIDNNFDREKIETIKLYSKDIKQTSLRIMALESLSKLSKFIALKEKKKLVNGEIVCSVVATGYFLEAPAIFNTTIEKRSKTDSVHNNLSKIHEELFCTMGLHGFNNLLFNQFVYIFKNENETQSKRSGAIFWANKLVQGYIQLKKMQNIFLLHSNKSKTIDIDLNSVNQIAHEVEENIYRGLKVKPEDLTLFGQRINNPDYLKFSEHQIINLVSNVTESTYNLILGCIDLMEPTPSNSILVKLRNLMAIYLGYSEKKLDFSESYETVNINKAFVLHDGILKKSDLIDGDDDTGYQLPIKKKKYGIWSESSEKVDWSSYPLGQLPW